MKVSNIFAVFNDRLYTVQYEGEERPEYYRLFDEWSDIGGLEEFFEAHKADLESGFYAPMTVEQAVWKTHSEAFDFEEKMENASEGGLDELLDIFKPLSNTSHLEEMERSKAYGTEPKSWLRIYALRIAVNVYLVTGGAIKLVRTMQERPHLQSELDKLQIVKDYLIDRGISTTDDFFVFNIPFNE
ncbi:hypothetical protein [Persicobacter psychrovividus]|uniref:Uncharacterized protein n=1 Tax=Persicobacter psychrovividus TaxID=387638 RepID=A0ABM7VIE7_9BACT|nr:hypothetical protein PEPS_30310 [Persicobacter psychrovividus]